MNIVNAQVAGDGLFHVAYKVTNLGGGQYHYEYAVHNVDNSRGAATLRVPIDASATASNFTFRDIDANALNNWTRWHSNAESQALRSAHY